MNDFALIILISVCGIPSVIMWLFMLNIMELKGLKPNWFIVSHKQYKNFWIIIQNEKTKFKKIMYLIIYWTQMVLMITFLIGVFIIIKYIEF